MIFTYGCVCLGIANTPMKQVDNTAAYPKIVQLLNENFMYLTLRGGIYVYNFGGQPGSHIN